MVEDRRSIISLRFSHTNPVTRYPKLSDLTFANSVAQPVSGSSPVTERITAYGVDVFYTGPYVLRRVCCLGPSGTERSTTYELEVWN
jgi:hypothetical protein